MSLPSDVNADVEDAARAMGEARAKGRETVRRAGNALSARIEPQHLGFAAAAFVAFLGVAVLGPKVREMRRPRRETVADRARRAARETRRQAYDARDEAGRRLRRLGGGTLRPR